MQNMRKRRRRIHMYDVIMIEAGPASLSAGIASRESNLNVLILDEFPKLGGRLQGQLHQEPNGEWWNGVAETQKLVDRAAELATEIRKGVAVHHIAKTAAGFSVHT